MRVNKIIKGDNMNKPKLYIMCGISASGKSTIANQIAERDNCIIVSSDTIRGEICEGGVSDQSKNEEVFNIFHRRIRTNLEEGKNVIADATNITIKSRKAIFDAVKNINCEKIGYIVVKSIEDCIKDNKNSDRVAVPVEVIYKQVRKFQIPFKEEGYDNIIIEDLNKDNSESFLVNDMLRHLQMSKFDQKNPYHNQTLEEHCDFVTEKFRKYNYPNYYNFATRQHDIGKMYTQTFDENGVAHYFGHEGYGTYILLTDYDHIFSETSFFKDEILDMLFLVNYHMFPMNWNTEKSKNKWRNIFGDYKYQLLLDFHECDKMRSNDINNF